MRDVGGIVGGVAPRQVRALAIGGDAHGALLHGEQLPRALEVRAAGQRAAGPKRKLVILHALLQTKRRKGSDADLVVRAIVVGAIVSADNVDLAGSGGWDINEIAQ